MSSSTAILLLTLRFTISFPLYKGKEVVKRSIDSVIAVDELIKLLKENEAWVDA